MVKENVGTQVIFTTRKKARTSSLGILGKKKGAWIKGERKDWLNYGERVIAWGMGQKAYLARKKRHLKRDETGGGSPEGG